MSSSSLDELTGSGKARLSFEDIDQRYRLKVRALIRLCMPLVFGALEKRVDMRALRAQGIMPIMFFLEFETFAQPLAAFGPVEAAYRLSLKRAPAPPDGSPGRLLLDMQVEVAAAEGSGDPRELGGGTRSGRVLPAGRMRGVHAITRPVAPPAERQVREVPSALQGLTLLDWDGPPPELETLDGVPEGLPERPAGPWQEQRSVWGPHNTDVNQHVNVQEYIVGMENHGARMLAGTGLPLARFRTERMGILFRKPSFAGEAHATRGRLFADARRAVLLGAYHRVGPEGALDVRPAVFSRMEGAFEDAG